MKKKYAAYILILSLAMLPVLRCGLIFRVAPMLLQGGYAMATRGEATIVTESGTRIKLTKNMRLSADNIVFPGSRLLTGPNSNVDLVFTDSIKVRLGANSTISLDASKILESENFSQIKMKLTKGRIFTDSGKLAKNSSLIISTLRSVVNVRGTEFMVEETGSSNTVLVENGSVAVTDLSGTDPKYVEKGEGASIDGRGKVSVKPLTGSEKEIIKEMSENIASLKAADKQRISDILKTNEKNIRLIKEAYETQKKLATQAVGEQKMHDARNLDAIKSENSENAESVKSSAAGDIEKIRNAAKEQMKK